ncbi:SLC13 family permease [Amorphus coralli]|uniref:SLC13 family permease n=1 Tax=Amorphus coralli TaxID=340680 RepID=UPI00036B83F3|nr:SLC13 family permease [Amorphus coralli]
MSLSLAVSCAIFALIAAREWLPAWLKIWHVMLAGAIVLLASGEIAPPDALDAIDWNVIAYLFAVFSIGAALYRSGVSHSIAERLSRFTSPTALVAAFVFTFAFISMLLTNDAAAIIGTPIAFVLATHARIQVKPLLIGLCIAVTVGSMATPIGNPQNLLVATSGRLDAPLLTFLAWLLVPTLLLLALSVWWITRWIAPSEGSVAAAAAAAAADGSERMWPAVASSAVLAVLVVAESLMDALGIGPKIPLGLIACAAAVPTYLFSRGRLTVLKEADWPTLIFFVAMFVVTGSLVESGSLQAILGGFQDELGEPLVAAVVSFLGSQVFSNVPLVDMYLKLTPADDTATLMMLAAISTLAGNVFIISAASNVIVVQQAERLGGPTLTFTEFTRAVLPIGLVSVAVTAAWILGVGAVTGG